MPRGSFPVWEAPSFLFFTAQAVNIAAARAALIRKAVPARNLRARRLFGGAFDHRILPLGNAFLTSSVEPDTVVSVKNPEMTFRGKRHKRE